MRISIMSLSAVLLWLGPAMAADLGYRDRPYATHQHVPADRDAYGYGYRDAYRAVPSAFAGGPYVVAPPATVMIVPPNAAPAPLRYAPPPLYPVSPPLITALPIVGAYLLPETLPPPATALDAYDHRFEYNQ